MKILLFHSFLCLREGTSLTHWLHHPLDPSGGCSATSRASGGFWPPDLQVAPSNSALVGNHGTTPGNHGLARWKMPGFFPVPPPQSAWYHLIFTWDVLNIAFLRRFLKWLQLVATCSWAPSWTLVEGTQEPPVEGERGSSFWPIWMTDPTLDTLDEKFIPKSVGQLLSSQEKAYIYYMYIIYIYVKIIYIYIHVRISHLQSSDTCGSSISANMAAATFRVACSMAKSGPVLATESELP